MVCSVAWAEEGTTAFGTLFTAGFDRLVYGWALHPVKEGKD